MVSSSRQGRPRRSRLPRGLALRLLWGADLPGDTPPWEPALLPLPQEPPALRARHQAPTRDTTRDEMRDTVLGPLGVSLPVSLVPPTSAFLPRIWSNKRGTTYPSADRPRPLPSEGEGRGVQEKGTLYPTSRADQPDGGTRSEARPDPAPPALEGRSQVPPAWANSSARLLRKGMGGKSGGPLRGERSGPLNQVRIRPAGGAKTGSLVEGPPLSSPALRSGPPGRGSHKTHYRTLTTEGLPPQPFSPGGGPWWCRSVDFRLDRTPRALRSPAQLERPIDGEEGGRESRRPAPWAKWVPEENIRVTKGRPRSGPANTTPLGGGGGSG